MSDVRAHPPTRVARRKQAKRRRLATLLTRLGRVVAGVLVLAGVAGFVIVQTHDDSDAHPRVPRSVGAARSNTDPRALLSNPDVADAFVAAASSEVVTVTESDYRHLDEALAAGLSVTTGAFRVRYQAALTGSSGAARMANHATTSVQVLQSAIGSVTGNGRQAKVLIFALADQTGDDIASSDRSVPTTLTVTVVRDGNQYLISDLERDANAGLPSGTEGLRAAAEAAREEVANTLTYRRASFGADLLRAQDGATGSLLAQITSDAGPLQASITARAIDLAGTVTSVGIQQATGDAVTMLIAATGTSTDSAGTTQTFADGRYVVTVERDSGLWLVSSLTAVGS